MEGLKLGLGFRGVKVNIACRLPNTAGKIDVGYYCKTAGIIAYWLYRRKLRKFCFSCSSRALTVREHFFHEARVQQK